MKTLKCMEVTGLCNFEAHGETAEETKAKLEAHGQEAHGDALASMSEADKTAMQTKIDSMLSTQSM